MSKTVFRTTSLQNYGRGHTDCQSDLSAVSVHGKIDLPVFSRYHKQVMQLSIIIPSYNNQAYLKTCLDSISRIKSVRPYTVVADDASTGRDVQNFLDHLAGRSRTHVLRNQINLGFGRTINRSFSFLKEKYPDISYCLILNQDTELADDKIDEVLEWMSRNPAVGIAGPRLLNSDGSIQNSFYTYPSLIKKMFQIMGFKKLIQGKASIRFQSAAQWLPRFARQYLMNFKDISQPMEVPWITGACLFINMNMLKDIQGFDNNFKMYAEDMDLCLRARQNQWSVYYYPGLEVVHHGGLKPSFRSPYLVKLYFDSLAYFYRKHYTGLIKRCLLYLNQRERAIELKKTSSQ